MSAKQNVAGINDDYTEKYGFHDVEDYFLKTPKGER